MLDNLPTEITDNILHRLPVKTLIRCTSLSKSFFSLITSRAFTSTHIAQNSTPHFLLRYFTDDEQETYHFEPDNDEFSGFQTEGLLVPFNDITGVWFNIVGSANGVLCLVNDCRTEGTRIILWNPCIRKYVHVPEPHYVFQTYGPYSSACGFGYDSVLDDYKVVRVVDIGPAFENTVYEVYSLKSGCWKPMGVTVDPKYRLNTRGHDYIPCSLHGSVHWVSAVYKTYPEYKYEILKFDMFLETFDIIKIPSMLKESDERSTRMSFSVQECMGMLSVICQGRDDDTCSVWVMKEYGVVNSWSKMFDFSHLRQHGDLRAFGFRKNGEVITIVSSGYRWADDVVSVDPLSNVATQIREIYAECHSFYLSSYVESMELFHEGKRIEDLPEDLKAKPRNIDPK